MRGKEIVFVALLLASAVLVVGCQSSQLDRNIARADLPIRGDGAQLFGAAPAPLGQEDLGYYAYVTPQEAPLLIWNEPSSSYVDRRVWDLEDNQAPNISHYRRWTYSDQIFGQR
jgi:hypothetical protein